MPLLLAACGSSDPGELPTGGQDGELLGAFTLELKDGTTSVIGKVYDGLQPETVIWTVQSENGGCKLSTPRAPFCPGGCGAGACVADNMCAAYPTGQDVGTVHLSGLATSAGSEIDLKSVANTYQPPAGTVITYPGFAEGDVLELTASGSDFTDAFRIVAAGVTELTLGNAAGLTLASGQPLSLAWNGATDPAASSVHFKLDISHHGGSKGMIECDVADNGALAIDAALVDQLLGLGVAGFPTIIATRSSTGHTNAADGHVDLVVAAQVEVPIAIPGLESCTDNTECTPPKTCQSDLTCK